jgi:transposase
MDSDSSYDERRLIGIDLHRRRSVLVHLAADGTQIGKAVRIENDVQRLSAQLVGTGESPRVVLEATYGWYWAADALAAAGAEVHLAHPLGVKMFTLRRVKNDERDAHDLADLLRLGRLPEAWIAPPEVRGIRELVRHRHKLVGQRAGLKSQVHAVLAKCGITVPVTDLFGQGGTSLLDTLRLPLPYSCRVDSLRRLIAAVNTEIAIADTLIAARLKGDPGYIAIRRIPGIGPVLAAVLVAEIGEITRFARPEQLCSWAGLTPRHRESDTTVKRGRITKQGSKLVRWAVIEAVQHVPAGTPMHAAKDRIVARRGSAARNIGKVAAARKLLTLVFYGLRDGHIRCLERGARATG